jgi:hypothetical protein
MKKLTLFLILLASLIIYGQTKVYVDIVFTTASVTSDSFNVPIGYSLSGLLIPASFTDSLTFQTSINGGVAADWFNVVKADGTAYIQIALTATGSAIPLAPSIFYPWRCIRLKTTLVDKKTVTIKGVCTPYLTKY